MPRQGCLRWGMVWRSLERPGMSEVAGLECEPPASGPSTSNLRICSRFCLVHTHPRPGPPFRTQHTCPSPSARARWELTFPGGVNAAHRWLGLRDPPPGVGGLAVPEGTLSRPLAQGSENNTSRGIRAGKSWRVCVSPHPPTRTPW